MLITFTNKNSEYWKGITVSVISENLSPIHRTASEKFSSKKTRNFTENVNGSLIFLPPAISQFLMADISFNIASKSWKLHKLLNVISSFNFAFSAYVRPRLLWVKSYANEEKCIKQWLQQKIRLYGGRDVKWITSIVFATPINTSYCTW